MTFKYATLIIITISNIMIANCQNFNDGNSDSNSVDIIIDDYHDLINESINYIDIVNKAKLLTLNSFGVVDNVDLNELLLKQPSISYFLNIDLENRYLIIKIKNTQRFLSLENGEYIVTGKINNEDNCEYLLVYSFISKRFYFLEGNTTTEYKALKYEFNTNSSLKNYQFLLHVPIISSFVKKNLFGRMIRKRNNRVCNCGKIRETRVY